MTAQANFSVSKSETQSTFAAMVKLMSYGAIASVIDSWERARQKYGCDEEIGTEIVLNLFRLEPQTKLIFGFRPDQNIEANPLLRMGVLVHAARMVAMIESVISLLGPDTDTLDEVLSQVGERHKKQGVKKEHFALFIKAVCQALADINGDGWTKDIQQAWEDILGDMADCITATM
jgi:hemoglobin-like flavoprotein